MASTLKGTIRGRVTFSVSSAMAKPQIFISKRSAPWYSSDWIDTDKVINTDESVSGQATVTCNGVTNMSSMFNFCTHLTSIDLSSFDTSKVDDMSWMFNDCDNLTSLDVSSFNTSNVTTMWAMFYNCSNLDSLDVSSFNTSNVTNMDGMFGGCSSLTALDLSSFNTSNVTNMNDMFRYCHSLTTIKGVIDMKSCTEYDYMFYNCPKLKDVKIKNPPSGFERKSKLSKSQYTIVS